MSPDVVKLLQDPARVGELPPEQARRLVVPVSTLAAALAARAAEDGQAPAESRAEEERLLTAKQVADRLGIPTARVYEMVRRRELPAKRFGRTVRIDPADLRALIARRGGQSY